MNTTLARGAAKRGATGAEGTVGFSVSYRLILACSIWLVMGVPSLAYAKVADGDHAVESRARLAVDEPVTWFAAHVPQPKAKPQRIHLTKLASANPAVTTKTVSKADLLNSRWAQINEKMEGYLADPQHCLNTLGTCKDPVFNQWVGLMKSAEKLRKARRLPVINRGINATLSYTLDRQNWGVTDYWASPEEALTRRRGDCEDYAILKYWSLALLGFDRDDMEVVAVFDQRTKQYHAILRIKQAGATYILDNRTARIRLPQDLPFYKTVFTTSEGADFTVASNFRTLSSLVDIATSGSKQDN